MFVYSGILSQMNPQMNYASQPRPQVPVQRVTPPVSPEEEKLREYFLQTNPLFEEPDNAML